MLDMFTHLANWLTYGFLGFTEGSKAGDAVAFFLEDIPKMFFLLTVMVYAIGYVRAGVDAGRIRDFLSGKNRFVCYLLAVVLGRAAAYVAIVAALVAGVASAPWFSYALRNRMGVLVGPMLIIVGAMPFGLVPLPSLPTSGWFACLRARLASGDTQGTFALGAMLALALCPSSAALAFGGSLPLPVEVDSPMLLPTVFGGASALPVFAIALTLAFAANRTAKALASLKSRRGLGSGGRGRRGRYRGGR